jgi:hypothetical protein
VRLIVHIFIYCFSAFKKKKQLNNPPLLRHVYSPPPFLEQHNSVVWWLYLPFKDRREALSSKQLRMWLVPQLWFGCVVLFSSAFIKAVDGFSKLPNGDGSNSLTGTVGTLRRYIHDWLETAPTTVQGCDTACQTKKKNLRDQIVHEFGPIEDWDLSAVTNMGNVFYGVESGYFQRFNADISKWNVGAVTHMDNSKYSLKKNSAVLLFCFQLQLNRFSSYYRSLLFCV